MNRDKDFHKKASGILVNKNTKDYRRAKNRNVVMKTAVAALGEDGALTQVTQKVDDMVNAPSRAEERVAELETQLAEQKVTNEDIKKTLNTTLKESNIIKERLSEADAVNQEISNKLEDAYELKNEFLKLKQMVEAMESK